jgi:hypothetical protein
MATYFASGRTRSPNRREPSLVASMRSGIDAHSFRSRHPTGTGAIEG